MTDTIPALAPVSVDRSALEAIRALQREGAPDLLAQVVRLYFESTPPLMERLRAGLAAGDVEMVRNAAHSLKSSSANLGATGLADLCGQLELAAHTGELGAQRLDADTIVQEYERVCGLLQAEIGATAR